MKQNKMKTLKEIRYTIIFLFGIILTYWLPAFGWAMVIWGIFGDISQNLHISKVNNITTKNVDIKQCPHDKQ